MRRGGKGGLIFFSAESIDRNMAESGKGTLSNEYKFRISGDVIRILVIVEFRGIVLTDLTAFLSFQRDGLKILKFVL